MSGVDGIERAQIKIIERTFTWQFRPTNNETSSLSDVKAMTEAGWLESSNLYP